MELENIQRQLEGVADTLNPIKTKRRALAWLIGWKILDVVSTLLAERVHGTLMRQAEINILANLYGSTLGWDVVIFSTLPLSALMISYFYERFPLIVESLALFLPFVVIGNFAFAINPIYNLYISTVYLTGFVIYLGAVEYFRYLKGMGHGSSLIWDTEYLGYRKRL